MLKPLLTAAFHAMIQKDSVNVRVSEKIFKVSC